MTMKRKKKKRRLRLGRLLAVLCIPLLLIAGIYVIYLNFNPVQLYSRDVVAE